MGDYISREALVDRLNKNLSACNPGTFSEMCYADAIETVKHFPSANVEPVRHGEMEALERTRWIPCSERMPNPGERVLATDGGFVGEMYIGKRGEWRCYNVTYIEDLMALDILWWMPLPEAPDEI